MSDSGRLDRPHLLQPELGGQAVEEARAAAQHEWDDVQLELVDEARCQVLIDDIGPAADEDVLSGGSGRAWSRAASMPSVTNVYVVSASVSGCRS